MIALRMASLLTLASAASLLPACGSNDNGPEPPPPPEAVASCREAALGSSDPTWRREASTAGPFGLFGDGRDFHGPVIRRLENGQLHSKIPAILDGTRPVILRVPEDEFGRVGLDYGDLHTEHRVEDAHTAVAFEPCRGRSSTGWPGGLVLRDRHPVTLSVEVDGGEAQPLSVGDGP